MFHEYVVLPCSNNMYQNHNCCIFNYFVSIQYIFCFHVKKCCLHYDISVNKYKMIFNYIQSYYFLDVVILFDNSAMLSAYTLSCKVTWDDPDDTGKYEKMYFQRNRERITCRTHLLSLSMSKHLKNKLCNTGLNYSYRISFGFTKKMQWF